MSIQLDDVLFGFVTLGPRLRRLVRDNTNEEQTILICHGENRYVQNMTERDWEQLGREVASNDYLVEFTVGIGAVDSAKMTSLFRGLKGSSSIDKFILYGNETGIYDVHSMIPFVQNASCLKTLRIGVHMATDGCAALFRALSNSVVEDLYLRSCGLTSLDIDSNHMPEHLSDLNLSNNSIGPDGCLGLAQLLQKENATLRSLRLNNNNINDEAVQILVSALRNNTSLTSIDLEGNEEITKEDLSSLLKLVNDVSSIKATLQSNHTLGRIICPDMNEIYIEEHINRAAAYWNRPGGNPERTKVIRTQLDSDKRQSMCFSQRIESQYHSISVPLAEIGPLLLPEVLEIVDEHHGPSHLYQTLIVSVADLWTTIKRKQALIDREKEVSDQIECLVAKKLELESIQLDLQKEIAAIEQKETDESNGCEVGVHMNKRQKIS